MVTKSGGISLPNTAMVTKEISKFNLVVTSKEIVQLVHVGIAGRTRGAADHQKSLSSVLEW